jgi:hypothetical protein
MFTELLLSGNIKILYHDHKRKRVTNIVNRQSQSKSQITKTPLESSTMPRIGMRNTLAR